MAVDLGGGTGLTFIDGRADLAVVQSVAKTNVHGASARLAMKAEGAAGRGERREETPPRHRKADHHPHLGLVPGPIRSYPASRQDIRSPFGLIHVLPFGSGAAV